MLRGAPPAEKIIREFADFTDGAILVAHNAAFDRRFLEAELALLGIYRDHKVLCTLQLGKKAFPNAESYKLANLVAHAGIQGSDRYHRALADAEVTAKLFIKIQEVLAAEVGPTVVSVFEGPALNTFPLSKTHEEVPGAGNNKEIIAMTPIGDDASPEETTYRQIAEQVRAMTPSALTPTALDSAVTLVEWMRDQAVKIHDANDERTSELDAREKALEKRARDLKTHERAVAAVLRTSPHATDERIKSLIDREDALAIREAEFAAIKRRAVEKSLAVGRPGDDHER